MTRNTTHEKPVRKDKSLTATGIVIAVIMVLLLFAYFQVNSSLRQRSLRRLEEGAGMRHERAYRQTDRCG